MVKSAPDLYNYVNYENDYYKVEEYLNRAISHLSISKPSGPTSTPKAPASVKTPAAAYVAQASEDDLSEEDLRAQLLD